MGGARSPPTHHMRLITAHRILIAASIAFFLLYGLIQFRRYFASGEMAPLAQTVAAVLVAGLLIFYYRGLAKRWNGRS